MSSPVSLYVTLCPVSLDVILASRHHARVDIRHPLTPAQFPHSGVKAPAAVPEDPTVVVAVRLLPRLNRQEELVGAAQAAVNSALPLTERFVTAGFRSEFIARHRAKEQNVEAVRMSSCYMIAIPANVMRRRERERKLYATLGALREEHRAELQGDFLEQSRVLKLDPIVEDGDMDWRATQGIVTVHHDVDDCLAIVRLSLPLYHPA